MSTAAPARGVAEDDRGEIGIGIMLAVTLTFIVAVAIVNIFMFLYGQAVVRSALDEGVRAGSRVDGGSAVCQQRAQAVLDDLMAGSLGDGVTITCSQPTVDQLLAAGDATFDSPMPGVPSWTIRLEARATQELAATPP
jgi:Flp pilus assembly protein TadG